MGLNCSQNKCCFGYLYWRCFRALCCFIKACRRRKRNKTSPDNGGLSPSPRIALNSERDGDVHSIHDQLSLFHFGQKDESGRRYSHPNQTYFLEEYERRKSGMSQPGSPCGSLHTHPERNTEFDYDETHVNRFLQNNSKTGDGDGGRKTPTSPVMEYPVVPPGRLL